MPKKILIVEDEANIRELLRLYLEREGYTVLEAENGVEGIKKWKSDKPDMLLLDVMMPVMDGWAVCREIRAESDVPIIMLTAKGETADRVSGLEMGADDYIVKPLEMPEVIARVRAVFRRMAPDDAPEKLSFDNLVIDKQAYDLVIKGKRVDAPPKEIELLYFLASSPNRVFTRAQLLDDGIVRWVGVMAEVRGVGQHALQAHLAQRVAGRKARALRKRAAVGALGGASVHPTRQRLRNRLQRTLIHARTFPFPYRLPSFSTISPVSERQNSNSRTNGAIWPYAAARLSRY